MDFVVEPRVNLGAILELIHKPLLVKAEIDFIFSKDTIDKTFTSFSNMKPAR